MRAGTTRRGSAAAVIAAGGTGRRMGGVRKQYLELGGEPVLLRAVRPFIDPPGFGWVIVVLPAEEFADPPPFLPQGVILVAGGAERGDSVRLGLEAVPNAAEVVVIHDAARPLLGRRVLDRVLDAVGEESGVVAAVPVADTLKRVAPDGRIVATVERTGLWRAQTPQAFPRSMIVDAYLRAAEEGWVATDDAALVERYGGVVRVVPGDARNLKLTHPEDVELAERLLADPSRAR